MAENKETDVSDLKKVLKEGKYTIGTETVLKGIRANKVAKVFMASNCNLQSANDIDKYSKLSGTQVVKLSIPNDELGGVCKKPFSISVIGVPR